MSAPATIARRVQVTGLVQGVFFRESMRREAEVAGVDGWVRNVPDGSVDAHLEGPAEAVERLTSWMRHGPPGARVDAVESSEAAPEEHHAFVVLR